MAFEAIHCKRDGLRQELNGREDTALSADFSH